MPASRQFSVPVGHTGLALESRVADLRFQLGDRPPATLALHTGASYLDLGPGRGEFHFSFLDRSVILTHPDFRALTSSGDSLPTIQQALLCYYFLTSDGTAPSGHYISFADLPDGRVYASAFQGYSGDLLARTFLLDIASFRSACLTMHGIPIPLGDAAFQFRILPRVDLVAVYYLGDEDFPSTCNLLFDAITAHHLPTEACAIVGSTLTQRILRSKSSSA